VRSILEIVLGVPLTAKGRDTAFRQLTGGRSPQEASEVLRWSAGHNTEKSGALLGAQAIFVVVVTFVLDRGWPKTLTLASLFLLLAAALILITNPRSTMRAWQLLDHGENGPQQHMYAMVMSRTIRFNIALYMTFLSIILLATAAAGTA
jgi:hypothetical protein